MRAVARMVAALAMVAAVMTAAIGSAARADVIPPGVREAEQRLRDNPKAFDRVDQFCAQRKVGAACTLPFYLLRGMAAGDVKLMTAVGAWFAPTVASWVVAFTFLVGGVLGIALTLAGRRRHGVPYALAIAIGTASTLLLMRTG